LSPDCTEDLLDPSDVRDMTEFDAVQQDVLDLTSDQCSAPAHDVTVDSSGKVMQFDLQDSTEIMRFSVPSSVDWQDIRTLSLQNINPAIKGYVNSKKRSPQPCDHKSLLTWLFLTFKTQNHCGDSWRRQHYSGWWHGGLPSVRQSNDIRLLRRHQDSVANGFLWNHCRAIVRKKAKKSRKEIH
jgi:hypothetical protein